MIRKKNQETDQNAIYVIQLSDYHMFPVNLTTRFIYVIETDRYNMNVYIYNNSLIIIQINL
jgi:hypothetical protein